jgi:hypothetical protein
LLIVVFSNRSYYNDEEPQERMAQLRGRPVEIRSSASASRLCYDRNSFDIWSGVRFTDPKELPKILVKALKVVKDGKRRWWMLSVNETVNNRTCSKGSSRSIGSSNEATWNRWNFWNHWN